MPREIPNEMPTTIAGWNQMCEDVHFNVIEAYESACDSAKEAAAIQFDSTRNEVRERLIAQLQANLGTEMVDSPDGQMPLSEDQYQERYDAGLAEIDKQLDKQRQEAIDNSVIGIEQPMSLEQVQKMYEFGKPSEEQFSPEPTEPVGFSINSYYQLGDGSIYSVADHAFVKGRAVPSDVKIIQVNDSPEQFRNGILEYYKANGFPTVRIGYELLTIEEYKIELLEMTDDMTSSQIVDGFNYDVNGTSYHFSFDKNDQTNFANKANIAQFMLNNNDEGTIEWQGWPSNVRTVKSDPTVFGFTPSQFLDLYANGAMNHLNTCLERGRTLKEEIRNCETKDALLQFEQSNLQGVQP